MRERETEKENRRGKIQEHIAVILIHSDALTIFASILLGVLIFQIFCCRLLFSLNKILVTLSFMPVLVS